MLSLLGWISLAAAQPLATARATWEGVLASGCDLAAAQVDTPFEALVLRNTPYALAGHPFDRAALTAFFQAEGGYTPRSKVVLEGSALACVERLKAREAELQRTVPMSTALMDRLLHTPGSFAALRLWSAVPGPNFGRPTERKQPDGGIDWSAGYPDCVDDPAQGLVCGGFSIHCEGKDEPCITVAAG